MYGVFAELTGFLQLDDILIDNNVFRLHYKGTFLVFLAASLMVTSQQFFGDPIDCMVDGENSELMDTYCWIHSTFTIPNKVKGEIGFEIPYHGIAPITDLDENTDPKFHSYYQWVAFFLFLQAILFQIPRFFWKSSESGKIEMLVGNLKEPLLDNSDKNDQMQVVANYLIERKGSHGLYALRFFGCELLNFINVVGQIFFIDFFLNYEFSNYGSRVLEYMEMDQRERVDPMAYVFPKMTKCNFWKYGSSGTIENKDAFCVLSLNIINEKIFIFLWFWLIIVSAISGIFLIYRLAVILGPKLRASLISFQGGKSTQNEDVEFYLNHNKNEGFVDRIGDWLVLYFVTKNLDVLTVNQLIKAINKKIDGASISEKEGLNSYIATSTV